MTRPHPTRINKRVPVNTASPKNVNTPQVEAPEVQSTQVNISQVRTQLVNQPQATALPSNAPQQADTGPDAPVITTDPAEPGVPVVAAASPGVTPLPAAEVLDDDGDTSMSYTSTLPDVFDVGMDDSAPPATGPWTIIDHFTGEMIIDDDQSAPSAPIIPTIPVAPIGPSLAGVEVATTPRLGTTYLVEIPPILLSEDEDVRPQWLMTAVNAFLRFVPYVGSLGKVVDLYLAQEARLGYPDLVCALVLTLHNLCSDVRLSLVAFRFHLATGPPRLLHS